MDADTFEDWEPRGGSNTKALETHYRTLPGSAADSIRQIMGADPAIRADDVQKIEKADAETVEIVYFNDVAAEVAREDYNGNKEWNVYGTKVGDTIVERLREILQIYFGPAWLVFRKKDRREDWKWNASRQRLLVRRVDRTEFMYHDETYLDARKIIEEIDVDATKYIELPVYDYPAAEIIEPRNIDAIVGTDNSPPEEKPLDIYIHRTGTGTAHIIRGKKLRETHVTDDVSCLCGRTVDAETVREGEIFHFADYVHRFMELDAPFIPVDLHQIDTSHEANPMQIFRENICSSCAKDYCCVKRSDWSGKIRYYHVHDVDFTPITRWRSSRVDELDWEPIHMEGR